MKNIFRKIEEPSKDYLIQTEGKTPEEIAKDLIALSKEKLLIKETAKSHIKSNAMRKGMIDTMKGLSDDVLEQVIAEIAECREEAERRIKEKNGTQTRSAVVAKACDYVMYLDVNENKATEDNSPRRRTIKETAQEIGLWMRATVDTRGKDYPVMDRLEEIRQKKERFEQQASE